jgi:predicted transcriptional regulator
MSKGSSYADALGEAQRIGYAEADPSDDVSGRDAAAKMAILARLAFGSPVHLNDVRYEGIEHLQSDDLEYARELGLGLKLVGTAERIDGGVSVHVLPTLLYGGHPLASVAGPFNAVTVESQTITEITMSGPGAGGRQTASAVLGDVVSVMTGGAGPGRHQDPRRQRRVDQVGRPARPRRGLAPRDGHPPGARVEPAQGARGGRRARVRARATAHDSCYRRGVRMSAEGATMRAWRASFALGSAEETEAR